MLEIRWLGRLKYDEAYALQHRLFDSRVSQHLLLLEHNHIYTMGVRAQIENLLVSPESVGAELRNVDRGGDITYHGPGQLVGYPIVDVPIGSNSTPTFIFKLEQLLIETLAKFEIDAFRNGGYPGVWVHSVAGDVRKIAAIGVRISRGRSMHGFALNVSTDMTMFDHIIPCGIADYRVTSLAGEGVHVAVDEVARELALLAPSVLGFTSSSFGGVSSKDGHFDVSIAAGQVTALQKVKSVVTTQDRTSMDRRLASAGVSTTQGIPINSAKPEWVKLRISMGDDYRRLKSTMRELELVTVCEEARCPNIYECWAQGTATFMINGASCTRSCSFCNVDTSKPNAIDKDEAQRVVDAVKRMKLEFAVITAVARDDLLDGGISGFVDVIELLKQRAPEVGIEVLIPDLRGRSDAQSKIFAARPDVLNHNIETVLRLQRAVRPQASYGRSLALLASAVDHKLVTKSGLIVGMGETMDELKMTLRDLASVGVEIVTIGQYLRPTQKHLPVARWYTPQEFQELRDYGQGVGIRHVESSPNTRSSYHAKEAGMGVRV